MSFLLGVETVEVTREAGGSYVDGRFVPGAESTFDVDISWQPMTGDDLDKLDAGDRRKSSRKGYTETELRTGNDHNDPTTRGDRLTVDGRVFRVHTVEQERTVLPHYKVIALELDVT